MRSPKTKITVHIEPLAAEALSKLAQKNEQSMSALVRDIVIMELITRGLLAPESLI